MELLRTAAGSKRALERLDQAWFKQESTSKTTNLAAASATFISTLISVFPLGGVALWISYTTQESSTTILALLILTIRAGAPLGDLVFAALGLNDLRGIMHDYRQITNAPTLPEPNHKEAMQPKNYDLSLQQIEITHAHKTINARILSGEKVQIAGPSGSGKSTLLSFLMRFDDPKKVAFYWARYHYHVYVTPICPQISLMRHRKQRY
ncbi:ATP-binding cassette domain-containing protein [Orrella sp. 11846]|uniref:ATP-binding cassette domain-containing protein n=1 Tax=Orrella sp. 11846 TaxID=3409913 RepID=UPI003B5AB7D8